MKNRLSYAGKILSTVTVLLLLWWIDWHEVADVLKVANGYWLFAVFVIIHMDRLFMAYKWTMLLRAAGLSVSIGTTVKGYYVGTFWSSFLPSSIGGDVVRSTWLMKKVQGGAIIVSSIVIERLLGTLALAIAAAGSFVLLMVYLDVELRPLARITFLLLVISSIAVAALFSRSAHAMVQKLVSRLPFPRVNRVTGKIKETTLAFKEKPGLLFVFLVLSVLEQVFPIAATFASAKAFSIELPIIWVIISMPIILIVSRMPISVNNFGIKEGAYAFGLSFAGVSLTESVMISVTDRLLMVLATLPGALWTVSASGRNVVAPVLAQGSESIKGK